MEKNLQVIIDKQDIAQDNAKQLIAAFGAPFTEAGEILLNYKDIQVTDESQKDLMAEARSKRLALKKVRTTVENKRKQLKEDSLRTGKAIDGVAKYIKDNIQPAEDYLELQEKYAENKELERRIALKNERSDKLRPYTDNLSVYMLEVMRQDEFDKLYNELKSAHELKVAQEKAYEEKLKAEQQAKEAEEKRIREENEALRKENESIRQKQLEEEKSRAAEERENLQLLAAPDKDKIAHFNELVNALHDSLPAVKTREAQELVSFIDEMVTKMHTVIETKVKEL